MRLPALVLACALAACVDDGRVSRDLGATCETPDECNGQCLREGDGWPGGLCTIACVDEARCPDGASCVDTSGGVCLYRCDDDPDCEFLLTSHGVAWLCGERRTPAGSTVKVCVGPP